MTFSNSTPPRSKAASRPDRYERQRRFPPIGQEGQASLAAARVLILGCGALGSVSAEILARAGVGHLMLVDRDTVEWSNLQRQSLYDEADAASGRAKADAAAARINQINSEIEVTPTVVDVTADNIMALVEEVDLVVDGTDNFGTRFLLNDAALEKGIPWVHGGCVGAEGQMMTFAGTGQPCFRCLVPEPPDPATVATCDTAGVVGAATHAIASLQAAEAIKVLSGNGPAWAGRVLSINFWTGRVLTLEVPDDGCPTCRQGRRDFLRGQFASAGDRAQVLCGRDSVQLPGNKGAVIDLQRMASRWQSLGDVESNRFFVRLRFSDTGTITLFRDGRAVVSGTEVISEARSVYARFVGG